MLLRNRRACFRMRQVKNNIIFDPRSSNRFKTFLLCYKFVPSRTFLPGNKLTFLKHPVIINVAEN